MASRHFPALGFDPARGNVPNLDELAEQVRGARDHAETAHSMLDSIKNEEDIWTGKAAAAFAGHLEDLPGYLDDAQRSMATAYSALSTWGEQLEAHQKRADELEQAAEQAQTTLEMTRSAADSARLASNAAPHDDAAYHAYAQAERNATAAADSLTDIRQQAENLRDTYEDNARICAEALDDARSYAPSQSALERLGEFFGGVKDVVTDNLELMADIAGIIATVAGVLALFPPLTPIAGPIALGATAAAVGLRAADMSSNDRWGEPGAWVGLGADAISAFPAGRALATGFDAGSDAVAAMNRTIDISHKGVGAAGRTFDQAGTGLYRGGSAMLEQVRRDTGSSGGALDWANRNLLGHRFSDSTLKMTDASGSLILESPTALSYGDDSVRDSGASTTSEGVQGTRALLNEIGRTRL